MSENFRELWGEALRQIGEEYVSKGQEGDFKLWFNMEYVRDEGNKITVNVPSAFFWAQQVSKGYVAKVEEKLKELTGQELELVHVETNTPVSKSEPAPHQAQVEGGTQPVSRPMGNKGTDIIAQARADYNSGLETSQHVDTGRGKHPLLTEEFTFESFVKGDNNDYAYSSCLAIARNPGQAKLFNPLLLYGGSGLGKTHLMQAVGNYIWRNNPEPLKICYTTTENFMNEFSMSLANSIVDKFTKKYRSYDVFLLDDIHFLLGKERLQEAIFNTFDALKSHNAQMMFTCDRPLNELKGLEERLRSRLGSGTTIDMAPPQFETRCAILQKKLELMGKELPEQVISYIAKNVQSNVRDLEGCLKKVVGYAELTGQTPDIAKTQNLLRDNFVEASMDSISMDTVQRVVAEHYNISISDIKGKKRNNKYTFPRQVAIYIGRELLDYSFPELGEEFGGRDHTTMMHSYEKISSMLKIDSSLEVTINMLIREIKDYKK
ncbi:MAG: chromosomal replication initiator protein DnaA [Treponema sp.]|nr:chromosomal replication initiator protein DnaA [Treponema sp.]